MFNTLEYLEVLVYVKQTSRNLKKIDGRNGVVVFAIYERISKACASTNIYR